VLGMTQPRTSTPGVTMDLSIWQTTDGHLHTSIPTTVPGPRWQPTESGSFDQWRITYVSRDYSIRRIPHGSGFVYDLYRGKVRINLAPHPRLKDAKAHAVRNAQGLDRVNVA